MSFKSFYIDNDLPISDYLPFETIEEEKLEDCSVHNETLRLSKNGKQLPCKLERTSEASYKIVLI